MLLSVALIVPAPVWDHAGYDAEDSYFNPHETTLTVTSPHTLWTVPLRTYEGCGGFGPPVIAGNRVVVPDQRGFSAYTTLGRAAWHFDWPDPMGTDATVVAIAGNTVIASGGDCFSQSDPNGHLVAVDLTTGKVRWRVDPDTPNYSFQVDKGVVVVSGESPSDELSATAYSTTTGAQAWNRPGYDSSGVSAAGRLLLTKGNTTTAVDIRTGKALWTKPSLWLAQAATPAGDRFLVTNGTAMSAVEAATGRVVWTSPGKAASLVAADGPRVFRAEPHEVEALSATTGRHLWTRRVTAEDPTQPVRAANLLFTGGPVLNPRTGAVIAAKTPLTTSPAIAGGVAYVASKGKLIAYAP